MCVRILQFDRGTCVKKSDIKLTLVKMGEILTVKMGCRRGEGEQQGPCPLIWNGLGMGG